MKAVQIVGCVVVLLVSVVLARADIAKPKTSPQQTQNKVFFTSLQIIPDEKATNATLQIRQSELNELRAALDAAPTNATIASSITRSRPRTMIAGLLLFLSVSFGGVWLARASRSGSALRRSQK